MKPLRHLRFILTVLSLSVPLLSAHSQSFHVDTVAHRGPLSKMINLVFMGDGYTEAELPAYSGNVQDFVNGIFSQTPFKEYINYYNIFAIDVISNQSGVSHPRNTADSDCSGVPKTTVDNYFGTTFDTNGIHRLLAPVNYIAAFNVLNTHLPSYDQVFIIANTSYYGGSGGTFATASTHTSANEVAVHEIGHSFAGLADEYWAGAGYAAEKPNMTKESSTGKVKWKGWLNIGNIGIYPHSEDPSWKRPHQNCKMRFLNVPFCNVCREAFVERVHDLVNPVAAYSPLESSVSVESGDLEFSVSTIDPVPNTLRIIWSKNDTVVSRNTKVISVAPSTVRSSAIVKAELSDTTSLSKSAAHSSSHVRVITWTLQKGDVITSVEPHESNYKLSVSPNPAGENLHVSYYLSDAGPVRLELRDLTGRRMKSILHEKQPSGQYDLDLTASELNMSATGVYLLTLSVNGTTITERIVRH